MSSVININRKKFCLVLILLFYAFVGKSAEFLRSLKDQSKTVGYLAKYIENGLSEDEEVQYGNFFIGLSSKKSKTWAIGFHCGCTMNDRDAFLYDWNSSKIVKGSSLYQDEVSNLHKYPKEVEDKIVSISKDLIKKYMEFKVKEEYDLLMSKIKKKDKFYKNTVSSLAYLVESEVWVYFPISNKNINMYNDLGFFFEQASDYKNSIILLQKIIEFEPTRTVAYINLGDAFFGNNNIDDAKQAYQRYLNLMEKSNKQKRIPKRVYDRLK